MFLLTLGPVLLWAMQSHSMQLQRERLMAQRQAAELTVKLDERLRAYEQVLRGAKALLEAAPGTSREQWKTYARSTLLRERFPGILGIGFAARMRADEVAPHEQRMRSEGFADYRVTPAGAREAYSAIMYIEPFEGRNLRAFGFDMWSEPVRRAAMQAAAESGASVLTAPLGLLQSDARSAKDGLLQYVAVYRSGMPTGTAAERMRALVGWVYIPYFAGDLVRGIGNGAGYRLELLDAQARAPIYDSHAGAQSGAGVDEPILRERMQVGERTWELSLTPLPAERAYMPPDWVLILALGTLAAVLLARMLAISGSTRRRAEALAADAESRALNAQRFLQAVLDAVPAPVLVKDEQFRPVLQNQANRDFLGVPDDENLGRPDAEVHSTEQAQRLRSQDEVALRSDAPLRYEEAFTTLSGEQRWVLKFKRGVTTADGKRYVVGALLDVTDSRASAAQREREQEFLDSLLDAIPHPLFVKDSAHRWVRVNDAFCRLLGRTKEQLIGQTDALLFERVTAEQRAREDDEVLRSGEPLFSEQVTRDPDGNERYLMKSKARVILPDGTYGVAGLMSDITERKRAQTASESDRELLNAVLAASPSAVWVKDDAGRWMLVNEAAALVLGAPAQVLLGRTASDLYSPEIAQDIAVQDAAALASDSVLSIEGEMISLHGGVRWGIKRKRAVALSDGRRILVTAVEDLTEHRQVQMELERSREFLVRILDAAPQPIFVKDEAHRWVVVNEAFCQAYGRSRDELIGRSDADFASPEWIERVFAQDKVALGSDVPLQWEDSFARADGSEAWYLRTKRGVVLPDGSRFVMGVNTDITQQKRVERSLRETQERLRVLNEIAGAMARMADLDEVLRASVRALAAAFPRHRVSFSAINAAATASVLYSESLAALPSLAGTRIRLSKAPALLEALRAEDLLEVGDIHDDPYFVPLRQSLAQDPARSGLYAPLRLGGELVAVLSIDSGHERQWQEHERRTMIEAAEYLSIAMERARARDRQADAERERAAAHAMLDAVISAIPIVVSVKDREGRITLINAAARDLHGVDPACLLGRTDAEIYPPAQAAAIAMQDARVRQADETLSYEERFVTASGELRWVVKRKRAVDLPNGERGVVTALYDVTPLKNTEEELRRHRDNLQELVEERTRELSSAKDAAERANRAKSEFLTNMSHELRTPMHAILSFARLGLEKLNDDVGAPPKLRQYFARIDQSGERLLHLLNDLLDLSKLESGFMRFDFEKIDLLALAAGILHELASLAGTAQVQLVLDDRGDRHELVCDSVRVGQVLRNLVSNAIKFTPSGGKVTLRVEEFDRVPELDAPGLVFEVRDTGIGIPDEEADLIFGKFMQSSRTRSKAGGTGLGLAICREIVHGHNGFIRASNASEGGAVFIVGLPLDPRSAAITVSDHSELIGEYS